MTKNITLALLALIIFSGNASAYVIGGLNADAVYSREGNNTEGNASGYRTGLMLGYGFEHYYSALKLGLGSDNFSGASNADQGQTDIELNVGYRLNPMLSAFIGYRNRSLDFNRTANAANPNPLKATERLNHFGLGAAMVYPLAPSWMFKADINAYYLNSQYENASFKNSGSGYSAGLSAGILRTFKNGFNASLTSKAQASNTGYFTGGTYTDILGSLSLGVTKIF